MPTKPTHIILIDDDPGQRAMIVEQARMHRLIVEAFSDLEQGIDFLAAHQKVRAVILDSCGVLDEEQQPSTGKTNFVFHAMDQINRIEHEQNRIIPFCVYGDDTFDLKNDLDGIAEVFHKKEGLTPLFNHLISVVEQLPEMLVRQKYEQVFRFIGDYMNDEDDDLMENLLIQAEKSDPASIVNNLSVTRRLLEKLFDVMCVNLLGKDPGRMVQKGKSRTRIIMETLSREKQLPYTIKRIASDLYSFTSSWGNHNQTSAKVLYQPGRYAVLSNIYFLLELFDWASRKISSL